MKLEATSDPELTGDYGPRICRLWIHDVGNNLPCTQSILSGNHEVYDATDSVTPFKDHGQINLGNVCPLNDPESSAGANKFEVTVVYELPLQPNIPTSGTEGMTRDFINSTQE